MATDASEVIPPPSASNDLAPAYMDHRIRLANASAADELLSRVRMREIPEKPGAATVPATLPAGADAQPSETSAVTRVVKDVGKGLLVEPPRAIVKGVRDAYQSTIDMASDFGGWLEQNNLGGGVVWDKSGVRLASGKEMASLEASGELKRPLGNLKLPDLQSPTTVTGGIIKGVTQFLVGMAGANKLASVAGVPEMTGAAGYGISALKGAVANFSVFDPHQERLSNLVQKFPALQNPVTEYLASSPEDNAAEGRFKNSLEGLGLGLLTDGFIKGVKVLREASATKEAIGSLDEVATAAAKPKLPDEAFRDLGDIQAPPEAPLVTAKAPAATPAAEGPNLNPGDLGKGQKPGEVFINFARIDTPDDVKRALQEMADVSKPAIDEARRGTQSFEQTKLSANQLNAWDILQSRRTGAPLNAEQSVAARQLWVSSADKLTQLAEAASTSPSEANLFAFRKMLSVHDAIQKEVIAARTETARSLSSWRIPVSSGTQRMQEVVARLDQTGGNDVARMLAQRVAALGNAGLTNEMTSVVEKGAYATTRDAVMEAWINGLLSNPTTHAANGISNTSVMYLRMAERGIGSRISSTLGTEDGVAAGEAGAQFFGHLQGMKDMFRYYGKLGRAFLNDGSAGAAEVAANKPTIALGISDAAKVEHPPSISSEAFGLSSESSLGRAVDLGGQVVRVPGSLLGQSDEFFKTVGYRMELNAQAVRQATQEVNAGTIAQDAFKSRVAEIIEHPPENIHLAAVDSALYQTFTNAPNDLAKGLMRMTSKYPALKVILPFTRTPANILNFTFERTPIAPLMNSFRQSIAAGGARKDLALAQMALGTAAMMTFADMTLNGQISGRGPLEKGTKQAMSREGWQPYSIKLGDRWVSYNRLDPVGSLVGMSADMSETFLNAQHEALDDPDTEKLAVAGALAFAGNLTNKTYLSGLSSIIEALNDPQQAAEGWAQRLAGSVIPSGVAQVERINDPTVREVNSMMDAIRARTPGLSKDLPAKMDMWGEPLTTTSGLGVPYDAFSPVYSRQPTPEPIDKEIIRNEVNIGMPPRRTSFNGVSVDMSQYPQAYARYVQLAGNEFKHPAWGMGAKDMLNAVVTGKHPLSPIYQMKSDGPDGGKDLFIRDIVSQYRTMARRQVLEEFPDLRKSVTERQQHQRDLRMPMMGQSTIQ